MTTQTTPRSRWMLSVLTEADTTLPALPFARGDARAARKARREAALAAGEQAAATPAPARLSA